MKGGRREAEAIHPSRAEKRKCFPAGDTVHWTDSYNRTVPRVLPTEALSLSTTDGHFQSL